MSRSSGAVELVLVGLSHREAGIEVRERLAVSTQDLPAVLEDLRRASGIRGLVILSTCNRLECYASASDAQAVERHLRSFFSRRCPTSEKFLFTRSGRLAVCHLFRVASGLDSIVVGEHQVLGQVKTAYQAAAQSRCTDKLLNKLFQSAFSAGKQVRSRTGIAQGITSCGGAAVALAGQVLPKNFHPRILLVGAGKMAEAAAQHMVDRSGAQLTIANRDLERARALAAQHGARALSLEAGMAVVAEMDVIIASTACPHYLVTRQRLADLVSLRGGRPLVIIDLGVPRNVDPSVVGIEGVHLYNIDHLEAVIARTLARRRGEIRAAEEISSTLAGEFCEQALGNPLGLPNAVIKGHAAVGVAVEV